MFHNMFDLILTLKSFGKLYDIIQTIWFFVKEFLNFTVDIPTWAKYVIPSLQENPSLFPFIHSPSFFQPKIYNVFTFISFCRTWTVEIANTLVFFQLRLVTYLQWFWYNTTLELFNSLYLKMALWIILHFLI